MIFASLFTLTDINQNAPSIKGVKQDGAGTHTGNRENEARNAFIFMSRLRRGLAFTNEEFKWMANYVI